MWTCDCLRQWVWRERRGELGIRRPLLKLSQPSVSCDIVDKSFHLSEFHVNLGIMTLQDYRKSLSFSDFLTIFYLICKVKDNNIDLLAIIYAYRGMLLNITVDSLLTLGLKKWTYH